MRTALSGKREKSCRLLIRSGLAALETVMIIGAMLPVAAVLFLAVRSALRLIHSLIGNLAGSPLL
jgi:hypothetical protein